MQYQKFIFVKITAYWASQLAPVVKNSPANAGDRRCGFNPWVRKIPLEEGMAALWRIPWTEESGGLQFIKSQKVGHN